MAYADLREYILRLEKEGELKRVTAEVDWNLELGAIMRRANDMRQPALLFENIKGYTAKSDDFGECCGRYKTKRLWQDLSCTGATYRSSIENH